MSSHIVFSIPSCFLFLFRFSLLYTFDLSVLYSPDGTPWRGGYLYVRAYTTANPRSGSARPKWISLQ
jgi:hypothetical protein